MDRTMHDDERDLLPPSPRVGFTLQVNDERGYHEHILCARCERYLAAHAPGTPLYAADLAAAGTLITCAICGGVL